MIPLSKPSLIDPSFHYGESQHSFYLEHGYHLFDPFLTDDGLAECQRQLDRMLEQLQPGRSPEAMISCHHQEPWIFNLATEPLLLDMIDRQVGPDIVLWSSHLLVKPPRTGSNVPWHQDSPYWDLSGELAAGVWIPMDDMDPENGTMSILPGWHRKGELPRRQTQKNLFAEEITPGVLPDDLENLRVDYLLKAGQLAIHHTMMPHRSTLNTSDRWRRVLVLRYMSADGEAGPKEYENFHTGEKFPRERFLVRGRDVRSQGLRKSPFK